MSEQEIKEQIDDLAKSLTQDKTVFNPNFITSYYHGALSAATAQDKIATNRTVEAAIKLLDDWKVIVCLSDLDHQEMKKELEKLRRA